MIEFYYKNFKKNYNIKINKLIDDIEKLFFIDSIELIEDYKICLDTKYRVKLSILKWNKINQLYFTLEVNKDNLSNVLRKFFSKKKSIKKEFTFVDTFAGCGGLSLGVEKAGFNPTFVNEIEARYLETYYFNRDIKLDNYFCDDIKKLVNNFEQYKENIQDVDLFIGGPPCQGFSMANRQRLIDDPRNELYKYYLKLLELSNPKYFIMENVKGMMNKSDEIKNDFIAQLGDRYSIEIFLLNAKDFGLAQNRERVFVIGSRIEEVPAIKIKEDILKEKIGKKYFKLNDVLLGLPALESKRIKNATKLENDKIGFKYRKYKYQNTEYEAYINEQNNNYLFNHTNRYNNDRDIEIFATLPQGNNSLHKSIEHIMPYKSRNHMFKDKYFKLDENKVCKTITAHMKLDCNMYIHPTQPRGLSPREAARVQTFPDDYVFMGSNNTWYAQIGNAVPVKLAEIIARNIYKHLD